MSEKTVIYLGEKKNIICIGKQYVDLSIVTDIEDKDDTLALTTINNRTIYFDKPNKSFSNKELPEHLKGILNSSELEEVKRNIELYQSPHNPHTLFRNEFIEKFGVIPINGGYKFYNKEDTEKININALNEWKRMKFSIINKWSTGEHSESCEVTNEHLIKLINEYFEMSDKNPDVLKHMVKVFGYTLSSIGNCLNIGDFKIDTNGNILIYD